MDSIFNAPDSWYYVVSATAAVLGIGTALILGKQHVQKNKSAQGFIATILLVGIVSLVIVFVRPYVDKCQTAGGMLKSALGTGGNTECYDANGNVIPKNDWK